MPNRSTADRGGAGGPEGEGVPGPAPEGLASLPWELPHTFLGLEGDLGAFHRARGLVLPVPYESTTSWGSGTRLGPRAILEASRYVELYDQELGCEPADAGIHTLPALELTRAGAEAAMSELESAVGVVLDAAGDRFVVMLGGEHSVSAPAIRAHAARCDGTLSVLQLDAHADLRPEYEGSPASHASAMARVLDHARIVGVGIRGISSEEVEVAASSDRVDLVYADAMWRSNDWMDRVLALLQDPVYVTFDVDYLDPSLMPSTGTPEPGGGDWYRTLAFLRRVFRERRVVGADVVELAPIPGLHAPDFLVAKLVYKLFAYRFAAQE